MTAQEYLSFRIQNGDQVSPISLKKIAGFKLKPSTIAYLEAGLPKEAVPYLSFVDGSNDAFTGIAKLENQYDLDLELEKYVVIGSDGSGDPIAINIQQDDIIEWLDH